MQEKALKVFEEASGRAALVKRYGIDAATMEMLGGLFGISGICNVIGAIRLLNTTTWAKTMLWLQSPLTQLIVITQSWTVCVNVMGRLTRSRRRYGWKAFCTARTPIGLCLGTHEACSRWHNLKYYTWVEQQGKSVQELDAQRDPDWWVKHQTLVPEMDSKLKAMR